MEERSEQLIVLRGEVRGGRKLDANVVNPLLRAHRRLLEGFKIEKKKSDGGIFKAWASRVDEFNSELLNEKTLLFSYQIKIEIFDSLPHGFDNYLHRLMADIAKGLQNIRLENGTYSEKIIIEITGFKSSGDFAEGKWPRERITGIGI